MKCVAVEMTPCTVASFSETNVATYRNVLPSTITSRS
jgi:hypothetical protein